MADWSLTLWQAERHFCHLRFTGAATILSFGHSMFTSLDSIGSAVGKRPIEQSLQLVNGLMNILMSTALLFDLDRKKIPN